MNNNTYKKIHKVIQLIARVLPVFYFSPLSLLFIAIFKENNILNIISLINLLTWIPYGCLVIVSKVKNGYKFLYRMKGADLLNHLVCSIILASIFYFITKNVNTAIFISCIIGIVKEVYDYFTPYSKFDVYDLLYNFIGLFIFKLYTDYFIFDLTPYNSVYAATAIYILAVIFKNERE